MGGENNRLTIGTPPGRSGSAVVIDNSTFSRAIAGYADSLNNGRVQGFEQFDSFLMSLAPNGAKLILPSEIRAELQRLISSGVADPTRKNLASRTLAFLDANKNFVVNIESLGISGNHVGEIAIQEWIRDNEALYDNIEVLIDDRGGFIRLDTSQVPLGANVTLYRGLGEFFPSRLQADPSIAQVYRTIYTGLEALNFEGYSSKEIQGRGGVNGPSMTDAFRTPDEIDELQRLVQAAIDVPTVENRQALLDFSSSWSPSTRRLLVIVGAIPFIGGAADAATYTLTGAEIANLQAQGQVNGVNGVNGELWKFTASEALGTAAGAAALAGLAAAGAPVVVIGGVVVVVSVAGALAGEAAVNWLYANGYGDEMDSVMNGVKDATVQAGSAAMGAMDAGQAVLLQMQANLTAGVEGAARQLDVSRETEFGVPDSSWLYRLFGIRDRTFFGQEDYCFVAGTQISMADGSQRPIELIRVGDLVLAFDEKSPFSKLYPARVSRLFSNWSDDVVEFHFRSDGEFRTVGMTANHPVLTRSGEFRPIGEIEAHSAGQVELIDQHGKVVNGSLKTKANRQPALLLAGPDSVPAEKTRVYNFEVESAHTYIAEGLRVHNRCKLLVGDQGAHEFSLREMEIFEAALFRGDGLFVPTGFLDANGLPTYYFIGESLQENDAPVLTLEEFSDFIEAKTFAKELVQNFSEFGSVLGSAIGNVIFDSTLERLLGTPILSAASAMVGAALAGAVNGNVTVSQAVFDVFEDLPSTLGSGLHNGAVGTVSSYLSAELMQALGINGTAGEILSGATSSTLTHVYNNLVSGASWNAGFSFENFWSSELPVLDEAGNQVVINGEPQFESVSNLGSALFAMATSYVGGRLSDEIYEVSTSTGSALGSVFGTIGSFLGAKVGGPIGAGIGRFLGQTVGGYWGDAWEWSNDTQKVIGVVGTLLGGMIVGGFLMRLFGAGPPPIPEADAETVLNFDTGYFVVGSVVSRNGGDESLVRSMAETAHETLNGLIGLITYRSEIAGNANLVSPTQYYGHTGNQIWVKLGNPSSTKNNFGSADEAVDYGTLWAVRNTKISGGDLYLKRAVLKSSADSVLYLSGDMQVAEDYSFYLQNREFINAAIAEPYESLSATDKNFYDSNRARITRVMGAPRDADGFLVSGQPLSLSASDLVWYNSTKAQVDGIIGALSISQFAAGWIVTLQRAAELGLDQTSRSDFFGGLSGFADSLKILSDFAFEYEHVNVALDGTTLNVSYAPDAEHSDIWAATNFFQGAEYGRVTGAVTQATATGQSLVVETGVFTIVSVAFEGGEGSNTSASGDLWIHSGAAAVTMDDRHTETYTVFGYRGLGGGIPGYVTYDPEISDVSRTVTVEGGDDIFVGNVGNDTLYGRSGFDWLDGGAGNDTLYGGSEDDTLLGRNGDDVLEGEAGDDYLAGDAGQDTLRGGDGNDRLVDGAGVDFVDGGSGDDTVYVSQDGTSGDVFVGGLGRNTLSFSRWNDAISNPVFLYWGTVIEKVSRQGENGFIGPEIDGIAVDLNSPIVFGDTFSQFDGLEGTSRNDFLFGLASVVDKLGNVISNGNDRLSGGAGDDWIEARTGHDVLEGGAGADHLDGGAGVDEASYRNSEYAVWIDLAGQEAFGGEADGDTLRNIENLRGSKYDDTFEGNAGTNTFYGGRGDDWFVATAGADRYEGEADFDTVDYSEYTAGIGVNLAAGIGSAAAAGHSYSGIEHIVGTDYADNLTGDAADNVFQAGQGNDTMSGGDGLDTYIFHRGDGADVITEAYKGGWDTLMFGEGVSWSDLIISAGAVLSFTLRDTNNADSVTVTGNWTGIPDKGSRQAKIDAVDVGGVGAVDIQHLEGGNSGWDGNDTINGDVNFPNHADILLGYGGNDTIRAGGADNYDNKQNLIVGGRGNDTIYASVGDDTYVFERGDGFDTVTDTGGADRIQFGPDVASEDVIFEIVGSDLYIGIRDLGQPELKASLVADRIRIVGGANTSGGYAIEYITAGGVDIDLRKLVLENAANGDWVWSGVGGSLDLDTGVSIADLFGGSVATLGYDPENNQTLFTVIGLPSGLVFNSSTGLISGTATQAGVFDVRLRAVDTVSGLASERVVSLNVSQTNRGPTSVTIADRQAQEDAPFSYSVSGSFSDPDGDVLTYSATLAGGGALPGWLSFNAATQTLSGTPGQANVGSVTVRVAAADPSGLTTYRDFSIVVANSNDGPRVTAGLVNRSVNEDAAFSFSVPAGTFVDDDPNDVLTYTATLASGAALPSWLVFNAATRTFSGTAGQAQVGAVSVRVTATDTSNASVSSTFTLTVSNVNDAPVVSIATADTAASEDAAFSLTLPSGAFTDVDGNPLALSASLPNGAALPGWLVFNPASRTFSGTPRQGDVGAVTIRVTASDGQGGSVTDDFVLTVSNVNDVPVASLVIANRTTSEDSPFSYTIAAGTFADEDGDVLTLSATLSNGAALPAWLTFNSATRTFSGTPGQGDVGNISVRVTATDPSGAFASRAFAIGVVNVNDVPVVAVSVPDQLVSENAAFSLTLPATMFADEDGDALALSASLANGQALPSWLSFNVATRTFSGTAGPAQTGSLTIRVTASDGRGGTVSDDFVLTVSNTNDAPVVSVAIADRSATEAQAFTYTLPAGTFADADGDALTLTATRQNGAALPAWLSFNAATRTFSGTPGQADAGTLTVRVTAADGHGGSVYDEFVVTVAGVNDAPVVSVAIANATAAEDQPFSFTVPQGAFTDADGDPLTFTASLASGSALPSWLTFNPASRTFSGTPAQGDVGAYTVRVIASDGRGGSVSDDFVITVGSSSDAPVLSAALADAVATEDQAFTYTVAAGAFSDADGDTLTLTAALSGGGALPGWLSFNPATRILSGTPSQSDVALVAVVVTATDPSGLSVSDQFVIDVRNVNDAPVLAGSLSLAEATEGQAFTLALPAGLFTDADGDALALSATLSDGSPLPSWLSLDASTGQLRGTPRTGDAALGTFTVRIWATDGIILSSARPYVDVAVTVAAAPADFVVPSITVFDDGFGSGAGAWGEGSPAFAVVADPAGGSNMVHRVTVSSWSKGGFYRTTAINTDSQVLRFRIYRTAASVGQDIIIRHGSGWASLSLNASNSAYWSIDGVTGLSGIGDVAADEWQTIEVDLTGLGITTFQAIAVQDNGHDSVSSIFYFDDITFGPAGTIGPPPNLPFEWLSGALPNLELIAGTAIAPLDPSGFVTDPDSDIADFEYSWSGHEAAGLSIDSLGRLSGTPSTYGTHQVTLTVTDPATGQSAQSTFDLTVGAAPAGDFGRDILNDGSFEALTTSPGSYTPVSSLGAWTAIAGGTIEVWNALNGVTATDGSNFLELDYLSNWDGLYQDVSTTAGEGYLLSFDARLRAGWAASTQTVEILWNGTVVAQVVPGSDWSRFTVLVTGTGGADRLTIRDVEAQRTDGIGALLDNFSLVGQGGGVPSGPVDQPWRWAVGALPAVELSAGDDFSPIDPSGVVTDTDSDVGDFVYSWSGYQAAGLSVDANGFLTGSPGTQGVHTVSLTVTDPVTGQSDVRSFNVIVGAPADFVVPSITVFDSGFGSGAGAWGEGSPAFAVVADPAGGSNMVHRVTVSSWSKGGFYRTTAINTDSQVLRFRIYRTAASVGQDIIIRHGSGWASLSLNASNSAYWSIDGVTGLSGIGDVAADEWQTIEVDLTGLGITTFQAIAVQDNGHDSVSSIFYFDDITFGPAGTMRHLSAAPDAYQTDAGVPVTFFPLANDTSPGLRNTLRIAAIAGQTAVTGAGIDIGDALVVLNANGSVTVTPDAGYTGSLAFTYTVTDGVLTRSATASVTVAAGVPGAAAYRFFGTDAAETLAGGASADFFDGRGGNDRFVGGAGTDVVVLQGVQADWTFTEHSSGVVVARRAASGTAAALMQVEQVRFAGSGSTLELDAVITSVTTDPVPEFLATPLQTHISEGGFAYPILIDLGGDGADLVSVTRSRVVFESDSGGPLMRMGWIGPQDGMLVLDRDGDGVINRLSEISFVNDLPGARSDLEGLRAYDTNNDGVFDGQDAAWSLFQVWRDVNQNGVGSGQELASLDEMGITSINLSYTVINENTDGFADSIILNEAAITMADGATRTIYDVALRGELAHVSGPSLAGMPAEWVTYSWTTDGGFGVAHTATGHSGLEDDVAALQTLQGSDLAGSEIPLQDLVRYIDSDDSLSAPAEFVFDPNDPLTPTFGLKPIVFDLDGDGLDLIDPGQSPILRDANGDGAEDRMGWVGEGDGFLALDRNTDGSIDPVSEISFVGDSPGALTDLEGLRAYDTNADGWLDASDADFGRFQIWQDTNFNATSDAGELSSLADIGIARIHLTAEQGTDSDGGPLGNRVFGEALFEWSDGSVGRLGDVELRAFEGNALEQAIQEERRAALLAASNFGAAQERARRHEAISQLGSAGTGTSASSQAADADPSRLLSEGASGTGRAFNPSEVPVSRPRTTSPEGLAGSLSPYEEWFDTGAAAGRLRDPAISSVFGNGAGNVLEREDWWLSPNNIRRGAARSPVVRSLLDRLAAFDLARESLGTDSETDIPLPQESRDVLAERQRFLQAIASFRGSSGAPLTRRYAEIQASPDDSIGAGASWLTNRRQAGG